MCVVCVHVCVWHAHENTVLSLLKVLTLFLAEPHSIACLTVVLIYFCSICFNLRFHLKKVPHGKEKSERAGHT